MNLAATVYAPPRARRAWTLRGLYAPAEPRFYGFGRRALAEALRLAGARGGRALLPAFVCRGLLSSVAAADAKPYFYEVGPDLSPVSSPGDWPRASVVLAVDFFGFPQNLAPFHRYARHNNAVLIEDAAHALFSRDESGRLLGARAPLGVLSPRKSLPLPNGGVLLVNDPALAASLTPQLPPVAANARAVLKTAARPLLGLAGARAAHAGLSVLRALRGRGAERPDPDSERVLPEPEPPCPELAGPLDCADPEIEASRRRALWLFCDGLARRAGLSPVFERLPEGVVPYAYALRAPALEGPRRLFAEHGLRVLPWPDLPAAIAPAAPEHYKNVALAHFLW